jgi:uncharacterized protein YabE (DUF348 family)
MNRNSTSSMGALHPVLFFLLVYGISLFLAFYVCRTVYYTINGEEPSAQTNLNTNNNTTATAAVGY